MLAMSHGTSDGDGVRDGASIYYWDTLCSKKNLDGLRSLKENTSFQKEQSLMDLEQEGSIFSHLLLVSDAVRFT